MNLNSEYLKHLFCSYLYFLLSAAVGPLLWVMFAYGKIERKHSKIAPNAFMGKLYSKIVLNNGRKEFYTSSLYKC